MILNGVFENKIGDGEDYSDPNVNVPFKIFNFDLFYRMFTFGILYFVKNMSVLI